MADDPFIQALHDIAEALNNISTSLDDVAKAIDYKSPADTERIASAIRDATHQWLVNKE